MDRLIDWLVGLWVVGLLVALALAGMMFFDLGAWANVSRPGARLVHLESERPPREGSGLLVLRGRTGGWLSLAICKNT